MCLSYFVLDIIECLLRHVSSATCPNARDKLEQLMSDFSTDEPLSRENFERFKGVESETRLVLANCKANNSYRNEDRSWKAKERLSLKDISILKVLYPKIVPLFPFNAIVYPEYTHPGFKSLSMSVVQTGGQTLRAITARIALEKGTCPKPDIEYQCLTKGQASSLALQALMFCLEIGQKASVIWGNHANADAPSLIPSEDGKSQFERILEVVALLGLNYKVTRGTTTIKVWKKKKEKNAPADTVTIERISDTEPRFEELAAATLNVHQADHVLMAIFVRKMEFDSTCLKVTDDPEDYHLNAMKYIMEVFSREE